MGIQQTRGAEQHLTVIPENHQFIDILKLKLCRLQFYSFLHNVGESTSILSLYSIF